MQSERFARAQMALQSGEMRVLRIDPHTWTIASKGSQYTVSRDGLASRKDTGTMWACTCPDFTGRCRQFGLLCKHIAAVRLTEEEQVSEAGPPIPYTNPRFPTPNTEEHMTDTLMIDAPFAQIVQRLRQPLDMNRVKRRQAPGQGTVPFLEGHDVIEAANEVFQFCWSFDLLGEPHIMRWDKAATFYDQRLKKRAPVLGEDGQPITEIAGVVYIIGRVIVELDGKPYSHADAGRCTFTGDTPEALDMAIAGAVTDCLKRCFRQMGEQFGLSLYDKEVARTAGLETSQGAHGNGHPEKRIAPTVSPPPGSSPKETLQYRDGTAVDATNTAELEAFHTFQAAHHEIAPASREALRAWVASHNGKK